MLRRNFCAIYQKENVFKCYASAQEEERDSWEEGKIITTTTFHKEGRERWDDPNDLKISPLIITVHKAQWYKNS
mgnify:CR=1 FL=1